MPLFDILGWLNVPEIIEYNKAIVLYKSTYDLTPSYICDLFEGARFFTSSYQLPELWPPVKFVWATAYLQF